MANLYMVGPLGEVWRDVPLRAQRILSESALIVTQDIHAVREWLEKRGIQTPMIEIGQDDTVLSVLTALQTADVAWLVVRLADLSNSARQLLAHLSEQGIEPLSVPGPSSAISQLVVAGLPTDSLTFLGVLSGVCQERRATLDSISSERPTVVLEAVAEDLTEVLCDLVACLGDRRVALHREQGAWRGQASQASAWPGGGGLTVVIDGVTQGSTWTADRVNSRIRELLDAGGSLRDVAREVARRSGWPRRRVYRLAVSIRAED